MKDLQTPIPTDITSTLLQANAYRSASNAELISNAIQAGMSGVGRI